MNDTPTPASSVQDESTTKGMAYFALVLGFAVLVLSFLSSCNTTRGFGRDVQKVGNRIERTAYRVQTGN